MQLGVGIQIYIEDMLYYAFDKKLLISVVYAFLLKFFCYNCVSITIVFKGKRFMFQGFIIFHSYLLSIKLSFVCSKYYISFKFVFIQSEI